MRPAAERHRAFLHTLRGTGRSCQPSYSCIIAQHYTNIVYTEFVKNITLSADENLIEEARRAAQAQHTTLNAAFRDWLAEFTSGQGDASAIDALMNRLSYVKITRTYTREERNER